MLHEKHIYFKLCMNELRGILFIIIKIKDTVMYLHVSLWL